MIDLWLDDKRDPEHYYRPDWVWVETAADAIHWLRRLDIRRASLDHDLTDAQMIIGGYNGAIHEDGVKSGYDVMLWLEQNPEFFPPEGIEVHSQNPAGARRMQVVVARYYGKIFWFEPAL